MLLPTMQQLERDRARRSLTTQEWSYPSMAAWLAMPPSHAHCRRQTAAAKPTDRMTCPPCTKSAVVYPESAPLAPSRDFDSAGGSKGQCGGRGVSLTVATTG